MSDIPSTTILTGAKPAAPAPQVNKGDGPKTDQAQTQNRSSGNEKTTAARSQGQTQPAPQKTQSPPPPQQYKPSQTQTDKAQTARQSGEEAPPPKKGDYVRLSPPPKQSAQPQTQAQTEAKPAPQQQPQVQAKGEAPAKDVQAKDAQKANNAPAQRPSAPQGKPAPSAQPQTQAQAQGTASAPLKANLPPLARALLALTQQSLTSTPQATQSSAQANPAALKAHIQSTATANGLSSLASALGGQGGKPATNLSLALASPLLGTSQGLNLNSTSTPQNSATAFIKTLINAPSLPASASTISSIQSQKSGAQAPLQLTPPSSSSVNTPTGTGTGAAQGRGILSLLTALTGQQANNSQSISGSTINIGQFTASPTSTMPHISSVLSGQSFGQLPNLASIKLTHANLAIDAKITDILRPSALRPATPNAPSAQTQGATQSQQASSNAQSQSHILGGSQASASGQTRPSLAIAGQQHGTFGMLNLRPGTIVAQVNAQTINGQSSMTLFDGGRPILGQMTLPAGLGNLPQGTLLKLNVVSAQAFGPQGRAVTPALGGLSGLYQALGATEDGWPHLSDALNSISSKLSPADVQAMLRFIPQAASGKFSAPTLFFLAALRAGDISTWLGDRNAQILRNDGKDGLIRKLGRSFSALGRALGDTQQAASTASSEWKSTSLPLLFGPDLSKLQFHVRQYGEDDNDEMDDHTKIDKRFILDFSLSRMGEMQIDSLIGKNRMDTQLRSEKHLSEEMRQDLRKRYDALMKNIGYQGVLDFKASKA